MVDVTKSPVPTTQRQSGPPQQPSPYGTPGSDLYDWYTINDALRNAGMDGWQIAGVSHTPTTSGTWASNPSYDKTLTPQENKDEGNGDEFIWRPGQTAEIGVVNPQTGQMMKLTLSGGPNPNDKTAGYAWQVIGRQDQGKIDQTDQGYKNLERLPFQDGHEEMWGTNSKTGAFEKLPNQPAGMGTSTATKGWTNVQQIEQIQPDGSRAMVWMGTPPEGGAPKPVPNMGDPIPTEPYVSGSIKQVTENGKLVYKGQRKDNGQFETITSLPSQAAPIETKEVGGQVYKQNPNAGQPGQPDFIPVTGIGTATEGADRWVDAGGGNVKHQIYRQAQGGWTEDPDTPQRPVSPEAVAKAGAQHQKGERYPTPMTIGGQTMMVDVIARGDGTYDIPSDTQARPIPGAPSASVAQATSTDQPTLVRYDPTTNQYVQQPNPNYQPTDPALRVAQLSQQATAKLQEIQAKIGPSYTPAQAQTEYDQWWNSNVEPAKQVLQQAQAEKQLKWAAESRAASEQQRANYATALQAGTNAVNAQEAMNKYRVGPGYGPMMNQIMGALGTGTFPGKVDYASGLVFQGPDFGQVQQNAVADALKHISPTAASIAGGGAALPQMPNLDFNSMLNRSQYQFAGGAPPPAAPPPAAPPPAAGGTTMTPNMVNMTAMPGFGGGGQSTPLPNYATQNAALAGVGVGQMFPAPAQPLYQPYQPQPYVPSF